jgi:hypothetical protein
LPRTAKFQEIFRLPSLCHIAIRVEAYRAQSGLAQCQNCQKFGQVWANCKQPPRCLWCGGGHLYKECPEKGNTSSISTCCKCRAAGRQKPIPPIIGAVDTRRRRCRSRRRYPGLQREGCSVPTSPLQACPLRRRSEVRQRTSSSLRHIRWQW